MADRRGAYIPALDGLRGVSAVVVIAHHCFEALPLGDAESAALLATPLGLFFHGQGAVEIFFVLSGFVLAASVSRNRNANDLIAYFTKRIFRIYPPYLVGLLFTWLASFGYVHVAQGQLSDWFRQFTHVHLTPGQLLDSMTYPGMAWYQLPVGWTLRVEMHYSFLLPLMLWLARRTHWSLLVAAATVVLFSDTPWWTTFALDFSLGIAVYLERERLSAWVARRSPWQWVAILVAALFVWSFPLASNWFQGTVGYGDDKTVLVMALGAAVIVILCAWVPFLNRQFCRRPVAWLGRVSFSLYLCHFPLLILLSPLVAGKTSPAAFLLLFGGTMTASATLAALGQRFVEVPSIRAGNLLVRRLSEDVTSARAEEL